MNAMILGRIHKTILLFLDDLRGSEKIISSTDHLIAGEDRSESERELRNLHVIRLARQGENETKEYSVQDFEKLMGHAYLPTLEFQDERTFHRIRKQCAHASRKGYVKPERKWLGTLHAEELRKHYIPDVSIRWIDDTLGYGLFAEKEIKAWEFVGEYAGVLRRRYPIFGNINDYCFLYPTHVFYMGKHMIDGQDKGNEIRYANHSDDPNCESISIFSDGLFHIILRAVKNIPPHTQITYDYSARYWKSRPRVPNQPSIPPPGIPETE